MKGRFAPKGELENTPEKGRFDQYYVESPTINDGVLDITPLLNPELNQEHGMFAMHQDRRLYDFGIRNLLLSGTLTTGLPSHHLTI